MKADLHCHTKISDGSMGISEIVVIAARLKIKYLSVTDHDTMGAVSRAGVVGKRFGVEIIPGAELSAFDYKNNKKVHILCYLPDYPDRMEGFFKRMADRRLARFDKQIKVICDRFPITPQMVTAHTQGCTTVFKQHIMHSLMDAGYADGIYGELFDNLFSPGKIADVGCEYESCEDVMQLIKSAGGLAVLAHPGHFDNMDTVDRLCELGLDGIEVEHYKNSPEIKEQAAQLCSKNGLLITGGSDFHGMYGSVKRPLGENNVGDDEVAALLSRKQKKNISITA